MSDDLIKSSPAAEGGASRRRLLSGMGAVAAGGGLLALGGTQAAEATAMDAWYYDYGPTRYCDSRENSGGRITSGETRTLSIFSGLSNFTFAINLTVVATQGANGYLSVYNADRDRPNPYSSINWQGSGKVVANFSMLPLGEAGAKIYCSPGASTHFIIDVVGYFLTAGSGGLRALPPAIAESERRAKQQLR